MTKDTDKQLDREIYRTRYREGAWNFHALSRNSTLPATDMFTNPDSLYPVG